MGKIKREAVEEKRAGLRENSGPRKRRKKELKKQNKVREVDRAARLQATAGATCPSSYM